MFTGKYETGRLVENGFFRLRRNKLTMLLLQRHDTGCDLLKFIQELIAQVLSRVDEQGVDIGLGQPSPERGGFLVWSAIRTGINRSFVRFVQWKFSFHKSLQDGR